MGAGEINELLKVAALELCGNVHCVSQFTLITLWTLKLLANANITKYNFICIYQAKRM